MLHYILYGAKYGYIHILKFECNTYVCKTNFRSQKTTQAGSRVYAKN